MAEDNKQRDTSARKFMVKWFTISYCLGHLANAVLAITKQISTETYISLWAGFTPVMLLIAEWYFKREDRATSSTPTKGEAA